jgi:hypothetical protein
MTRSFCTSGLVAALLAVGVVAACGGDDAHNSPADHPAGLLVAGDFNTASTGSESSNLMFALQDAGFPLDTMSGLDSISIAHLIAGKDIVFFPEIDGVTFTANTGAILRQFVDNGGTLVLVGGYTHTVWVNAAFGWGISNTGDGWAEMGGAPMPQAETAAGTPFVNGPSSVFSNNSGANLYAPGLPEGAKIAYYGTQAIQDGSVVVLPSGGGRVVYFGWDWYDGKPFGSQDGGWADLLALTAAF